MVCCEIWHRLYHWIDSAQARESAGLCNAAVLITVHASPTNNYKPELPTKASVNLKGLIVQLCLLTRTSPWDIGIGTTHHTLPVFLPAYEECLSFDLAAG